MNHGRPNPTIDGNADGGSTPLVPSRARLTGAVVAVALAATLAAAAGVPVKAVPGEQIYGDEPHYLITALSIGEDFSLDVSDEYAEECFRLFYQRDLNPQAAHQPDGSLIEPHSPLLSVLLALPTMLGGWVAAKLTLAVLAGVLAGLMLWTAVRRCGAPLSAAVITVGLLAVSAPLAVYGSQIYPEVPAALAVTIAAAALTGGRMQTRETVALGLAVIALPWFAVKYVPVAGALAAVGFIQLWRSGQRRAAVGLTGVAAVAAVVFFAANFYWYGGITPYVSRAAFLEPGGQVSEIGTDAGDGERTRRLMGLLIDRGYGLAAWQPAWLLIVPAAAALLRHRPAGSCALLAPLLVGWLVASFVAVTMHGLWFPARHVFVALPTALIILAWWAGQDPLRLILTAAAGTLGVIGYAFLVVEGTVGDLTWITRVDTTIYPWLTSELPWIGNAYTTSYPWYRLWRTALPDYAQVTTETWALTGVWFVLLAALALWGWRTKCSDSHNTV